MTVTPKPVSLASSSKSQSSVLTTKRKQERSSLSSTEGAKAARRKSLPLTKRESRPPKYLDDYLPSYIKKAKGKSSTPSKK